MKEYAKNKVICRRRLLLSNFGAENIDMQPKHLCCDICQIKCTCCGNSCDYESNFYVNTAGEIINILPTNELTEIGKKELSKQLLEIRGMYLSRGSHCGKGINCSFPIHAVKEIISIVSPELSVNDLKSKTSVFNELPPKDR